MGNFQHFHSFWGKPTWPLETRGRVFACHSTRGKYNEASKVKNELLNEVVAMKATTEVAAGGPDGPHLG